MNANRCCCKIVTDDFNRAGPAYGANWHKESGTDPTIASSTYLNFSAPAELRCTTAHPDGNAGKAQLKARFALLAADDRIRFKLGWLDANNYVYIEIVYQDSAPSAPFTAGCSFFHIGSVEAGVDYPQDPIPLVDLTAGVFHDVALCWFPDYSGSGTAGAIVGKVTCSGSQPIGDSVPCAGGSAELGSYASIAVTHGTAKVDDFYYGKAQGDGCSKPCPTCGTGRCPIDGDDMNRADSADNQVGCKWGVRDGHQRIHGNRWEITANNSRAQFLIPHPGLSGGGLIARDQVLDVAGAVARLYIGGVYLQYEVAAHGHTLSIYDGFASGPTGTLVGTPVTNNSDPTGEMVDLTLCIGPEQVQAGYGYGEGRLATASAPGLCTDQVVTHYAGTSYIGGNNGTILDNFSLEKYRDPDAFPPDPDCSTCECDQVCDGTNACCHDPQTVGPLIVDLGAGGWTSRGDTFHGVTSDCGTCVDAAGEIVLTAPSAVANNACIWGWADETCISQGFHCNDFGSLVGRLQLKVQALVIPIDPLDPDYTVEKPCRWYLSVSYDGRCDDPDFPTVCDGATDGVHTFAVYHGAPIGFTDCNTFPVALSKVDAATDGCPCEGDLPNDITLDQA